MVKRRGLPTGKTTSTSDLKRSQLLWRCTKLTDELTTPSLSQLPDRLGLGETILNLLESLENLPCRALVGMCSPVLVRVARRQRGEH